MTLDKMHVIIVGGGASGVLLACHLLRANRRDIEITLIERRRAVGLGTAYSTSHPKHLLNVRASNMSAFADEPEHFQQWLARETDLVSNNGPAGMIFAPRSVYGRYINSLIKSYDPGGLALRVHHADVVRVGETAGAAEVETADGDTITGDAVVLATGFSESGADTAVIRSPWSIGACSDLAPGAPVLVLGTGLTMVDLVVELKASGHSGPIYALSRRGLLPQPHRPSTPFPLSAADVPFGASVVHLCRWLRRLAVLAEQHAGDWRSAIDAIRPYTAQIWRDLPFDSKKRFLRHARAWWDVHRHRMAPSVASEITTAIASEQLRVTAGNLVSIEENEGSANVTYRPRGGSDLRTISVARIYTCMGVSTDPAAPGNAALASLLRAGRARADELNLGLDIADNCSLIGISGRPSSRLFAIGPITRGAYWEMIAVPDIRLQCAKLANELLLQAGFWKGRGKLAG